MKAFINDFSAGNIGIKYHLVTPVYTSRSRIFFSFLTSLIALVFAGLIVKFLDEKNVNSWAIMLVFLAILIVPFYILGNILLRYNVIGKIYFNEDRILIESADKIIVPYDTIIKIEYCGNLLKSYVLRSSVRSEFKTYIIRFVTNQNRSITIEATENLFVLPEEKKHFSKPYPVIERTLREINPKFGNIENRQLRRSELQKGPSSK